jgi:sugar fermentation stimulation protein A
MPIRLLDLPYDAEGIFLERPNRFLGIVDIVNPKTAIVTSKAVKVHVHDPGRLKEILYPGNRVLLKKPNKISLNHRKTSWNLLAGQVNDRWILVNSGFHRKIVENILVNDRINPFGELEEIRPEVKFGKSILDFLVTNQFAKQIFVEVKGCTLTIDGRALFPDAPTERGSRHLEELVKAIEKGYRTAVIILVFRIDSECFAPNTSTDPKFAKSFKAALTAGVEIHPIVLSYRTGCIYFEKKIPVCQEY